MVERKRGALSVPDMTFIKNNVDRFTVEEMARALGRTVLPVERYIARNKLGKKYSPEVEAGEKTEHMILKELKLKAFYRNLTTQLSIPEVSYFCEHWVNMLVQFNGDLLASEEMELKELIILEILKNREGAAERERLVSIEELNREIKRARQLDAGVRDKEHVKYMQAEILSLRTASSTYVRNLKELCDRADKMRKALHASRELRAKDLQNSKIDFAAWLKWLDEYENRSRVGREMEIIKLAKQKEALRLSQYHVFSNKDVTKPILNAETVDD